MSSEIVVGANVDIVTQRLVNAIGSLPSNKIVKLSASLYTDVLPFLSATLQGVDALFGLKLNLQANPSMAHSGWLYSRYLDACRKSKLDPATAVSLYSNGFFREFGQFGVLEPEALFDP